MNSIILYLYHCVKHKIQVLRFRINVLNKGGFAGKALQLLNSKHIEIGQNIKIKDGYRIECYAQFNTQKLNPNFRIGDGVIIGHRFTAFVADKINIEKDTIFAGNVTLITENHGVNPESDTPYHAQNLTTGPISIGRGCWLGQNVSILPNVQIGDKCVIATGAVVTSNIPDYSIAAGCPAKVIKRYNFQTHRWEKV